MSVPSLSSKQIEELHPYAKYEILNNLSLENKQINETIMELELKHLAAYLPYNVLVRSEVGNHWDYRDEIMRSPNLVHYERQKMYLRPLSDLTKEIEHNGEKFVLIMRIFGGSNYEEYDYTIKIIEKPTIGQRIEISVKGLGDPCISFSLKNILNNRLDYENWQKLLEWHFDIHGLIPAGLAIDINTLNE